MMRLRATLSALALAGVLAAAAPAAEPRMDINGIHSEPWFQQSFLVLAEDWAEAAAAGKRFALVWEQKGCSYCREMHEVHLADPSIGPFIRDNFLIVQLDLRGDRQVTDFDGEVLTEKEMARKYRISLTPTVQFLPSTPQQGAGRKGAELEVARMPGLLKPELFRAMFEYVAGGDAERSDFHSYLRRKQDG